MADPKAVLNAAFDKSQAASGEVRKFGGAEKLILQKAEEKLNENFNLADRKRQAESNYMRLSENNSSKYDAYLSDNIGVLGEQAFSSKKQVADQAFLRLRDVMETQDKRRTQLGDTFEARLNDLKEVQALANEELERTEALQRLDQEQARIDEQKRQFGITESRQSREFAASKLISETTDIFGNKTSNATDVLSGLGFNVGAGTTTNRPDANANPFNVKMGSLQKYGISTDGLTVDDQNHIKFKDAGQGLDTGLTLIQKITERYPDVTIGQLGWAEDKTWNAKVSANVSALSNGQFGAQSKITDIPQYILAKAIAKQEGFTGTIDLASGATGADQTARSGVIKQQMGNVSPDRIAEAAASGHEVAGLGKVQTTQPNIQATGPDINQVETSQDIVAYLQAGGDPAQLYARSTPENLPMLQEFVKAVMGGTSGGGAQLPATSAANIADAQVLPTQLNDLKKIIETSADIFGPLTGRLGGLDPTNTKAQTAQSKITAVTQVVGKYMEGGVLRAEDTKKYEKILPSLNDKPEVAKAKIENVVSLLQSKYKTDIQSFANAGFDVSKFPPELDLGVTPTAGSSTEVDGRLSPEQQAALDAA